MEFQSDITINRSNGFTKSGKPAYYISPRVKCINRARRVIGIDRVEKCIKKYFYPRVILYEIDGSVIGSNSKENALKEYWRVCELNKVGTHFEVKLFETNQAIEQK